MSNARNLARLIVDSGGVLGDANAPSGSIIQQVSSVYQYRNSTASTSYTALAAGPSITPRSTSSKIYVALTTMVGRAGNAGNAYFAVYRNGTTSLLQTGQVCHFAHWNDYNSYTQNNSSWVFVDSPNTTSPVSYTLMGKSDGSGVYAVSGGRPNDDAHNCGVLWTLMEVAA